MRRRRPGRWLAPLALLIVAIAVYAIVQGGSSKGGAGSGATTSTTSTTSAGGHKPGRARAKPPKPPVPATYTVQQGDTLVGIAAKTGVPLDRLQSLNPGLDASAMHIGQRIRLRK